MMKTFRVIKCQYSISKLLPHRQLQEAEVSFLLYLTTNTTGKSSLYKDVRVYLCFSGIGKIFSSV